MQRFFKQCIYISADECKLFFTGFFRTFTKNKPNKQANKKPTSLVNTQTNTAFKKKKPHRPSHPVEPGLLLSIIYWLIQ